MRLLTTGGFLSLGIDIASSHLKLQQHLGTFSILWQEALQLNCMLYERPPHPASPSYEKPAVSM